MTSMEPAVLPAPVFEGSEKRIEIHFTPTSAAADPRGLRVLPRQTLDYLMTSAACEIVSHTPCPAFDSYVLSESSLFIYPTTFILKTCGTTQLLDAVAPAIAAAAPLGLRPTRLKYSRASFLFPKLQPEVYHSFSSEVALLRSNLPSNLELPGAAYVLGDHLHGLQWHVYVLAELKVNEAPPVVSTGACSFMSTPKYQLEVCMTGLSAKGRTPFIRDGSFVSATKTTCDTGIQALVPRAAVDDYVFEPCGYSMNGVHDEGFITIHITPEETCSYASCELYGFADDAYEPSQKAAEIASIFQPAQLVCALSVDAWQGKYSWGSSLVIEGYACTSATCQELPTGGRIWYYSLIWDGVHEHSDALSAPAVMKHWPSFATLQDLDSSSVGGSDPSGDVGMPNEDMLFLAHKPVKTQASEPESKRSRYTVTTPESFSSGISESQHNCDGPPSPTPINSPANVSGMYGCFPLPDPKEVIPYAHTLITKHAVPDSFAVVDLSAVQFAHMTFCRTLPRVTPYYSVKAITDRGTLAMLAALGAGFNVVTEEDIYVMLDVQARSQAMVLNSVLKRPRDLRGAAKHSVPLVTFHDMTELAKINQNHPSATLLLRIMPDGEDPAHLLASASSANLNVEGISVDLSGNDRCSHANILSLARSVVDHGTFTMRILSLGAVDVREAQAVQEAISTFFPVSEFPDLKITATAEPGGVVAASTFFSKVHGAMQCSPMSGHAEDVMGQDMCTVKGYAVVDKPVEVNTVSAMRPGMIDEFVGSAGQTSVIVNDEGEACHTVVLPDLVANDWLVFESLQPCGGCMAYHVSSADDDCAMVL